jgi:hypothetical protein
LYRVENAVHTEVGTSLGLSIVRGIMEKHGCTVQMVSALGVGTTFWFDLPCEEADSDELVVQAELRRYRGRGCWWREKQTTTSPSPGLLILFQFCAYTRPHKKKLGNVLFRILVIVNGMHSFYRITVSSRPWSGCNRSSCWPWRHSFPSRHSWFRRSLHGYLSD